MAIDIHRFIKNPEYNIRIITYRDVFQAAAYEQDRFGEEYRELSAVIMLDAAEMRRMGIKDESNVRLISKHGSVIVKAKASPGEEQKGIGFMVNSPWSNALVSADKSDGFPEYKNIDAKITISNEEVTDYLSFTE